MLKKISACVAALLLLLLPVAKAVPVSALATNPIANPSVEAGAAAPDGWTSSSWGTNTPTFEYVNEGHNSSKSVKVTMSNYTDGDAKWYFNPISTATLQVGEQYRFTTWYKGNVIPKAVAMYCLDAFCDTAKYFGMPNPQPPVEAATAWQKYSETFSVPQGAVSVSVFLFINENGWLQTDDYSIEDYTPTGFDRPLLTLTFDDGHEDNVANALPLMEQYGVKSTQCYATEHVESAPETAPADVLAFHNAGHEICSHTVSHPMLTGTDDATLAYELQHSKQYLESIIGQEVPNFASPYGDYNKRVNDAIKAAGYQSHRTVDEGYNSKDNLDAYRLRVQNIFDTTTADEVRAWIQQAQADNTWLILVYHRVVDTSQAGQPGYEGPGQYDTSVALFTQHLQAIQQSGIAVETYQDALTEVQSQMNPPADTTPPVIGSVNAQNITQSGATLSFQTSELAKTWVEYGTTTALGTTAQGSNSATNHAIPLSGLNANTQYFYRVYAQDAAGNTSSFENSFTTSANPGTPSPVISNVQVGNSGNTSSFISWTTDVITTAKFEYGTTTAYGTTITSPLASMTHFANPTGLTPNTQYFFKITATTLTGESATYTGTFTPAHSNQPGDVNGDGPVNIKDATIVSLNWGKTGATREEGDLNGDGKVDIKDATIISLNWSNK